jgi:capsular polysaccharide biosynthesis protein
MSEYESILGMNPDRTARVHFKELIFFRDSSNNAGRSARAAEFRQRVLAGRTPKSHPGVFILRGMAGDRRLLRNEVALAEELARTRGFRILDPLQASVAQIVEDCGGADVVAGVEGSHLVHGAMIMPPRAALLVLQPPERVVGFLKILTDRQNQRYAFVIGSGGSAEFEVDAIEVQKTLDLL